MKLHRIRLHNFKPYEDVDLSLNEGVTVIHGLNGSGKSSLLEGCFFALYGAKALPGTLADVVTNGKEESAVELWFSHAGDQYHLFRRVRWSGDRPQTAECTLEGPDGTVEGARDVRAFVTDLLRMDAEAFVNCAYVRQGEVNKLINATPGERQRMIDELLQLGTLEQYRERAREARLGVEDVLSNERGRLEELDAQIERKEERELHDQLNALRTERNELDGEIDRYETQRDRARETHEQAAELIDEHEETREELDTIEADIDELEGEIREAERERERLRERAREATETAAEHRDLADEIATDLSLPGATDAAVADRRATISHREATLRDHRRQLRDRTTAFTNQADRLHERATEHEERAAEKRDRAAELDADADGTAEELAQQRDRLADVDDELEGIAEQFADADVDRDEVESLLERRREDFESAREEIGDVRADLQSARDAVAEAEQLLEAGNCPECGQPVDGSPHVESIDDRQERVTRLEARLEELREQRERRESDLEEAQRLVELDSRAGELERTRELLTERISGIDEDIDDDRAAAEQLREEAEELDEQAEQKREVAERKRDDAAAVRAEIETVETDLDRLDDEDDRLDDIAEHLSAAGETQTEVERLRDRADGIGEVNDQRRERLTDLRQRRKQLSEAVDEGRLEAAREQKQEAEEYLERVEGTLEELRERRDDLQGRIGGIKQDIAQLEELRDQREDLGDRVEALESLREESERLETTYGDLRAELRQRNVESLERMLNETFELVYGNDAYARIRLDGSYELSVIQKDGDQLDPEQLSGGERALFNLSLRCAIYRLLAEGIEGTAPLPPLILDEPTVFLDSGHVRRLIDLVAEMRSLGVSQIVIVSHDEELIDAADDLITVQKDPTTNRSTASRADAATLGAVDSIPGDDD